MGETFRDKVLKILPLGDFAGPKAADAIAALHDAALAEAVKPWQEQVLKLEGYQMETLTKLKELNALVDARLAPKPPCGTCHGTGEVVESITDKLARSWPCPDCKERT